LWQNRAGETGYDLITGAVFLSRKELLWETAYYKFINFSLALLQFRAAIRQNGGFPSTNMFVHTLNGLQACIDAAWERLCRSSNQATRRESPRIKEIEQSVKRWQKVHPEGIHSVLSLPL